MKRVDMTNVKEAGDFTRLPAGPYICVIRNVEDVEDKEYLKITYDIAEGEYAGHFDEIRKDHSDWAWCGAYVRSYKTKALPMFKRFCSSVSKSNGAYVFDGNTVNSDEKTLIGKKVGITFQEEEYYGNDGTLKTRLIVYKEFPVSELDKQSIPKTKKLEGEAAKPAGAIAKPDADGFMNVPDGVGDELPWGEE